MWNFSVSHRHIFLALSLNMAGENLTLTAIYSAQMHRPQLKVKSNSGECYAACCHSTSEGWMGAVIQNTVAVYLTFSFIPRHTSFGGIMLVLETIKSPWYTVMDKLKSHYYKFSLQTVTQTKGISLLIKQSQNEK